MDKLKITILILLLIKIGFLPAQTIIDGGDVFGEWNVEGSPYIIDGDITVPPTEKLSIKQGVNIIFLGQFYMEIQGRLYVSGTATENVTFTVSDTSGYSSGNYEGWYGIGFNGMFSVQTENSYLKYCNIEYSMGSGISCIKYSNLVIENCEVQRNKQYGIRLMEFSDIIINSINVSENKSGGISISSSAPQVSNFNIFDNAGTGIVFFGGSSGVETSSFINGSISNNHSLLNGGGVAIFSDAYPYFENVEITENSSLYGGGISCEMGGGDFVNITLKENTAGYGGAVSANLFSDISFDHALIAGNYAEFNGGGSYFNESHFDFIHCTISNNTAGIEGGGIYCGPGNNSSSEIINSIIWNNFPEEILTTNEIPSVSYSDILGGYVGVENIDADPLFVDPLHYDYNLHWTNFPEIDFTKSPCIDMADPNSPLDSDGTIADMGAFFFDQEFITSVNRSIITENISIYPNPASDIINITEIKSYERLLISNMIGEKMIDMEINNNMMNISISEFETGIYILYLLQKDGSITTEKFIKK